MFTGIIKTVGAVISFDEQSHVLIIKCAKEFSRPHLGASVAVDGVCLTVSHVDDNEQQVGFDLGQETRNLTLLAKKQPLDLVNVEYSLSLGSPMDGHIVQGHVDGIAQLLSREIVDSNHLLQFSLPQDLKPYIVRKGSIAINGTSLTVNTITLNSFSVCLVPYTVENTSFHRLQIGDFVHLETDIVGRYLCHFAEHAGYVFKDLPT